MPKVCKFRVLIIPCDPAKPARTEEIEKMTLFDTLYKSLGCDMLQLVRTRDTNTCLLVDGNARIRNPVPPLNHRASEFAGQPILGDVAALGISNGLRSVNTPAITAINNYGPGFRSQF